jgi:hypothetical protein
VTSDTRCIPLDDGLVKTSPFIYTPDAIMHETPNQLRHTSPVSAREHDLIRRCIHLRWCNRAASVSCCRSNFSTRATIRF